MEMEIGEKRGLSPVIATILLIAMVMVIGLIVFMWLRSLTQEKITKFDGTNIQLVCDDVYFQAEYSGGTLSILNSGNVPIYNFKVKVEGSGSYTTSDIGDISTKWAGSYETGLDQGAGFSDEISFSGDQVTLIPVLLGESEEGKKTYTCDGNLYGYVITI